MAPRFNIGVDYEIAVAPDFYFAPGLFFASKGSKFEWEGVDVEETMTLNYLEVPLNLVYKPVLGNGNLIVAFGPYLGYGLGGKYKVEGSEGGVSASVEEDITFGSNEDEDLKPLDVGANIGFGYMFGAGLSLQFNTQLGLVNISHGDDAVKNTGFGLSLGYRF